MSKHTAPVRHLTACPLADAFHPDYAKTEFCECPGAKHPPRTKNLLPGSTDAHSSKKPSLDQYEKTDERQWKKD